MFDTIGEGGVRRENIPAFWRDTKRRVEWRNSNICKNDMTCITIFFKFFNGSDKSDKSDNSDKNNKNKTD